jgi:hypothetical protein
MSKIAQFLGALSRVIGAWRCDPPMRRWDHRSGFSPSASCRLRLQPSGPRRIGAFFDAVNRHCSHFGRLEEVNAWA